MGARVLVVCTANIARSPLAEVLLRGHVHLRGLSDQVSVTSGGVRAQEGRPAAPPSARIAKQWGFDLSNHRARAVTEEDLATTNLVLTMTTDQRDLLNSRAVGLGARCFTVGEFSRLIVTEQATFGEHGSGDDTDDTRSGYDLAVGRLDRHIDLAAERAHRRRPRSIPGPQEDVPDPYGHGDAAYIEVANLLAAEIAVVADALFGPGNEP